MADDGFTGPLFCIGDRVQFWDGGPAMHVVSASTHLCHCSWVDDFGSLQHGTFEHRNLTYAAPSDSLPPPPD